jgi:hypothetical protein
MEPPVKLMTLPRALAVGAAVVIVSAVTIVSLSTSGRREARGVSLDRVAVSGVGGTMSDMAQSVAMSPPMAATPAMKPEGMARSAPEQSLSFRQPAAAQSMIIRTAGIEIQVDSLERAMAAVRQFATSLGGHIGSMNAQTGEHQMRSAMLVMKIPAARFDNAMNGMPSFGKILSSSANSEDVGEEFVDVTARVANARRLEDRLVTLLATRTGKLQDVLTVERELARVRQEIERYEGRLQWMGTQVAMSTISVNVHEKAPIIATPGTNPIGDAFVAAWKNFVRLVAAGIAMSGVLVPVAALGWIGFQIWKRLRPLAQG